MKKLFKTLALSTALVLSGGAAYAEGTGTANDPVHNGCSSGPCNHTPAPTPTPTPAPQPINMGQGQNQGQNQGQGQIQGQGQNQGQGQQQTANGTGIGVGVGTGIATSNAGASAVNGSVNGTVTGTNTNTVTGTNTSTNTVTGTNTNANTASTGPVTSTNANTAATGPINVAPQQSTVNSFRSFVGTNAPNLSGSVDNCLAVLGWSGAVNFFGNTGIGIGGGNQRTEYVEQCAAVKSAFEVWNRADGDINKETFAIEMLVKALPKYAKPAMDAAVERINTYIEQNGDAQPDSVMNIFGAKSFKRREAAPVAPAQPVQQAPANGNVTLNLFPVVETKETVRTVVATQQKRKPAPAKKPDCGCAK